MAMTKKEAEAHKKEIDALKLRVALCWTPEVRPDIPPPEKFDILHKGWLDCHNRVEPACSSTVHHGFSHTEPNSQQPRSLYSTRLLALRALRNSMEQRFARELMHVDNLIAEEQANPTPTPPHAKRH
jgi:hypothetical protein